MKKKRAYFTIARLIASGALLGVVVAGMFGVDLSQNSFAGFLSGTFGAAGAAVVLKIVHIL